MNNWIDLIRYDWADLFNMNAKNSVVTNLEFGTPSAITHYDKMMVVNDIPDGFPGVAPTLIFYTPIYQNVDENCLPHGNKPAPAQRFGIVTMAWGHLSEHTTTNDTVQQDDFIPHREDGFPAIIEFINIYRHFNHGRLHRVGNHPAIKADYVSASWYLNGHKRRVDGPCGITVKNYQEFWKDDNYNGFKSGDCYLSWSLRNTTIEEVKTGTLITPRTPGDTTVDSNISNLSEFLESVQDRTDLFSNRYFTDDQDEICFVSSFI